MFDGEVFDAMTTRRGELKHRSMSSRRYFQVKSLTSKEQCTEYLRSIYFGLNVCTFILTSSLHVL